MKPPKHSPSKKEAEHGSNRASALGLIKLDEPSPGFRRALYVVIGITGSMSLLEAAAGHFGFSHALQADALDFLDDMLAYTLSLATMGSSLRIKAAAATLKAVLLCMASLWILGSAIFHLFVSELPRVEVMGTVGVLGLLANAFCQILLAPHLGSSPHNLDVGLSVRHDMMGNIGVIVTAAAVWVLDAPWPDLLIAIVATGQLFWMSAKTLPQAITLYRTSRGSATR